MAGYHHIKKLETYRSLYRINRHFNAIVRHCWTLEKAGFMPILKMKIYRGLIRELQSQISHEAVERMHGVEERDMYEFGKTRIAWEHQLNPDRPGLGEN